MASPDRMADDDDVKLYGIPGAEHLHLDPAGCYEADIEDWLEESKAIDERREIEEWSSKPLVHFLPSAENIIERIIEIAGDDEIVEDGYDQLSKAGEASDVIAAFDAARQLLGSKCSFRMADKHLRSLWVTWDDADQPLLDGEPMYVKREA